MGSTFFFEALLILSMSLVMNMVKHWTLLIIGDVFAFDYQVKEASIVFYIILSYTAYFYGKSIGSWGWHKLEENFSEKAMAIVSIMAMAVCNFLLGLSGGVNKFIAVRFLTGVCTNVGKISSRFLIENVPVENIKLVFMLKTGTNLIGTISSPFLGYLIQRMTHKFSVTCAIIAVLCFLVSILGMFFSFKKKKDLDRKNELVRELEIIRSSMEFRQRQLAENQKTMWQTYIVENSDCRNLIILLVVNGCMMEADFVITSLFFTGIYHKGDFLMNEFAVGCANLLSSLVGAALIIYINKLVPSKISYKVFLASMVIKTAVFVLLTPFAKYIVRPSDYKTILLTLFYVLKYAVSFYLYEGLIVYFISKIVDDEHAENLLRRVKIVMQIISGTVFGALIWLLNFVSSNHSLSRIQPFNYTAPFWIIAAVQLATVHLSFRVTLSTPGPLMDDKI